MKKIIILIANLLILFNISVSAQNVSSNRLKLAETFMQNADFKNAEKIFSELYEANPSDKRVYKGYTQVLYAQNKFTELLPIIEKNKNSFADSQDILLAAETYWKLGKSKEAEDTWDKAVETAPKDTNLYKIVINSILRVGNFERGISVISRSRKELDSISAFAEIMSDLYLATGQKTKAADELLNFFVDKYDIPKVQGRIQAMIADEQLKNYFDEKIRELTEIHNDLRYTSVLLYCWFLCNVGRCEEALDREIAINKEYKKNGYELYSFATARSREGNTEIAMKAYAAIIDLGKECPYIVNAMFGYNRAMEQNKENSGKISKNDYLEIIDRYRNIVKLYSKNSVAQDATYRIAMIQLEKLNDVPAAIEELSKLQTMAKNQALYYIGTNKLGDIYLMLDSTDKAREYYNISTKSKNKNFNSESDYAKYQIAEMYYFNGQIDSASTIYAELAANTESMTANDALEKVFFIEQNKEQNKAIRLFAVAEKYSYQKKYDLAIDNFRQAEEFGNEELKERSLLKIAEILKLQSKRNELVAVYKEFSEKYPESIFIDQVLFDYAESMFDAKEFDAATKLFTKIITDFPRSIYIENCRQRIREIRASAANS